MSTNEINAFYRWTEDEMVTAQLVHTVVNRGKYRWLRIVALGSMIFAAGMLFLRQGIFDWRIYALVGLAYAGVIISEVTRHPKWIERSARRLFARTLSEGPAVKFKIDQDGVHSSTQGLGGSHTPWSEIYKVIETRDGFLLYLNKQLFLWMPRRALSNKAGREQFRALLKANDVDFTRLN